MKLQTREQVILETLVKQNIQNWKALESRAEALPALLLRHGALPVKLFLLSKGNTDKELWNHLEEGVKAILTDVNVSPEGLAKLPFEQYLLVNEVAVEVATLLARWIKVHTADDKPKAAS